LDDQGAPMVDLRPVRRVPLSSQFVYRCGDADLEIGGWVAAEGVPVDRRASHSGGRACCGVVDQGVPGWGWPWRGAGEQVSQVVGVCDPCSHGMRAPDARDPGEQPVMPPGAGERVGAEPPQDRLDDRGVIQDGV
jgi:hypothetical protein